MVRRDIVNYVTSGYFTDVRDQRETHTCYPHSYISVIEARFAMYSGRSPEKLSIQQVIDGRVRSRSMNYYLINMPWLTTEENYPNRSSLKRQPPEYEKIKTPLVPVMSMNMISPKKNESYVEFYKNKLSTNGPLVAHLYVNKGFRNYKAGEIYEGPGSRNANDYNNHEMALVGYGDEDGTDYWILRNSWGAGWGENGDMRVLCVEPSPGVDRYTHGPGGIYSTIFEPVFSDVYYQMSPEKQMEMVGEAVSRLKAVEEEKALKGSGVDIY